MCDGSFNVVEAAQAAGVKKVVAASSASVYGLADTLPDARGPSPVQQPHLVRREQGHARGPAALLSTTCTACPTWRCATSTSTARAWTCTASYTEVLIRWMDRIAAGQPPLILGDGRQTMDFVYVDDVARANVLALQSDVGDEVFNVASGTETSLQRARRRAAAGDGLATLQPEYGPERKVNPVPRRLADTAQGRAAARLHGRGRPRRRPARAWSTGGSCSKPRRRRPA